MLEPNSRSSSIQPLLDYLNKHRENEKFNQAVEISATLLLITFFLVFAIKPTVNAISTLVGDIKSKEILSREMRTKINKMVEAQDAFSQVQERYLVIESSLPDSPRFAHIIGQVYGTSQDVGGSMGQTTFNFPENQTNIKDNLLSNNPSLKKYTVNATIGAQYPNLINYIKGIFANRRLIGVKNITVKPFNNNGLDSLDSEFSNGTVNLNITTDVYYWSQK